jgi:hypothetical protein
MANRARGMIMRWIISARMKIMKMNQIMKVASYGTVVMDLVVLKAA